MSKKKNENPENEILTWAERTMGDIRPHATKVGIIVIAVIALFGAVLFLINARTTSYANQWRDLHLSSLEALQNQNTGRLLEVSDAYPNESSGLWSLLIAADYDLRTGLRSLATDRSAGFRQIQKAKESLEKVVQSNSKKKSTDLQRRSIYNLAYVEESLGEFKLAEGHYQQLLDAAPDSAYAPLARRGLKRCQNPTLVAAYQKFREWEDVANSEAPGPSVSDRPDIGTSDLDFGDDLPAAEPDREKLGVGGGDLDAANGDTQNGEGQDEGGAAAGDDSDGQSEEEGGENSDSESTGTEESGTEESGTEESGGDSNPSR